MLLKEVKVWNDDLIKKLEPFWINEVEQVLSLYQTPNGHKQLKQLLAINENELENLVVGSRNALSSETLIKIDEFTPPNYSTGAFLDKQTPV